MPLKKTGGIFFPVIFLGMQTLPQDPIIVLSLGPQQQQFFLCSHFSLVFHHTCTVISCSLFIFLLYICLLFVFSVILWSVWYYQVFLSVIGKQSITFSLQGITFSPQVLLSVHRESEKGRHSQKHLGFWVCLSFSVSLWT